MNERLPFLCLGLLFYALCSTSSHAQNLLNTSTWTVGSGSVAGFTQNGPTAENSREYGANHIGENVILWKATPGTDGHASGGWNTSYHNIDHTKDYRFTVWLKKTNSNDGHSYLGCNSTNNILKLDGSVNNNPYFWVGDLPKLNRWYLIVGFVHKSSYTSTVNHGRIYDGVTGEEVATITDFKFKNTAINVRHRSYLYYDSNTADRQYFYAPRLEQVNGSEPSITELLRINTNSKLLFAYDNAGNQKQRFYCPSPGCSVPTPPAGKQAKDESLASRGPQETSKEEEAILEDELIFKSITVYPNPTDGTFSINMAQTNDILLSEDVYIYNSVGTIVKRIPLGKPTSSLQVNLSGKPSGIYYVHMHLDNGKSTTKKVIIK